MYATECPNCHKELVHNDTRRFTVRPPQRLSFMETLWPVKLFRAGVRLVES